MQENDALKRAMAMVADLRARCPWDRIQTRATLRPYLLEEAHELDRALGSNDPDAIREEVADLLLHLAWQLVLAQELGEFTPEDAATDLESKMRRRHPQLFDLGPQERWEALKRRERKGGGLLDGLSQSLPELLLAYRLQERAAAVGFDWPDTAGPISKVLEELDEVKTELDGPKETSLEREQGRDRLEHEIGDLLFAVVNLSRKAGIVPSAALEKANIRFRNRFGTVEELAASNGLDLSTAGLEALDTLWEEAKRRETQHSDRVE